MKKILVAAFTCAMLLTGCGTETDGKEQVATQNAEVNVETSDTNSEDGTEVVSEEETTTEEQIAEEATSMFSLLPDTFDFCSGAGGWWTDLYLEDDGTFHGIYHDSDLGSTGEDYPNGTIYISNFEGKFAEPEQVTDYAYSTTIEYINVEREGEEYIEEGIRYIVCEPYGLNNAQEIMIYLYGTPRSELPEGFLSWMIGSKMGPESLQAYGIYNVNEETAFSGVLYEEYKQLCKLAGSYKNEAGDELVIRLSEEMNENSYDLGFVDWIPKDGEQQLGTITKNAKGGFNINLEESVSYSFKITNYEEGSIEFFGDDKWAQEFGTFIMQ